MKNGIKMLYPTWFPWFPDFLQMLYESASIAKISQNIWKLYSIYICFYCICEVNMELQFFSHIYNIPRKRKGINSRIYKAKCNGFIYLFVCLLFYLFIVKETISGIWNTINQYVLAKRKQSFHINGMECFVRIPPKEIRVNELRK